MIGGSDNLILVFSVYRHCTDEGITTVTEIPYFEGDFWPNVIEETIKELDQEEEERKASEAAASGEVTLVVMCDWNRPVMISYNS